VELAAACGWPGDVLQNARNVESHVETLCPDHELCEVDSLREGFNAYKVLGLTRQNLKGIIADNQIQSFDTMRAALVNLQESVVPGSDTDMFDAMNRVLFGDWPQRRSTQPRSGPPLDHQENQENESSVPGHQLTSPEDAGVATLNPSLLDEMETQEGNFAMTSDAFAGSMEDTVKSESGTSSLSTSSSESDSSDDSSTSSSDTSLASTDKKTSMSFVEDR
jgi:hypothetical protein